MTESKLKETGDMLSYVIRRASDGAFLYEDIPPIQWVSSDDVFEAMHYSEPDARAAIEKLGLEGVEVVDAGGAQWSDDTGELSVFENREDPSYYWPEYSEFVTCPECGGDGEYLVDALANRGGMGLPQYREEWVTCDMCHGTGKVPRGRYAEAMEYYDKPAANHPADQAIHDLVYRYGPGKESVPWSDWQAIKDAHPGADFRLGQLYGRMYPVRDGDYLVFRESKLREGVEDFSDPVHDYPDGEPFQYDLLDYEEIKRWLLDNAARFSTAKSLGWSAVGSCRAWGVLPRRGVRPPPDVRYRLRERD
jgi:hypothetical protein